MIQPIDVVLLGLKTQIMTYTAVYERIHGSFPDKKCLDRIVFSSLDQIEDPKVRAKLRRGVTVVRADVKPDDSIVIRMLVQKKALKALNNYLTRGRN